jgi:hypothetical protein
MKKILFLFSILGFTFIAGCYYDNVEELYPGAGLFETCDTSSNVSYTNHIVPIMQNYCYSCHSGATPVSGQNLESHASLQSWALSGDLEGNVYHQSGFNAMPPSFQLDSCRMKQFHNWIAAGAPNN